MMAEAAAAVATSTGKCASGRSKTYFFSPSVPRLLFSSENGRAWPAALGHASGGRAGGQTYDDARGGGGCSGQHALLTECTFERRHHPMSSVLRSMNDLHHVSGCDDLIPQFGDSAHVRAPEASSSFSEY
jgi:hypothetical protein